MHNHPSVSLISVADMRFFLQYGSIRLLVIVTNLGSISYMVKSRRYDYVKAVRLLNQTIQLHNKASDLKEHQKAARYFISNCYKAGIIYEDGNKEATDMINYPKVSLGESLEASRAAAWIRESEAREIECREL